MAGRKPNSKLLPFRQLLPIPLFTMSYRPFWVRGAKHLVQRDENGKITFNSKKSRMVSGKYHQEFLHDVEQYYTKLGYKDIKFNQQIIDLPKWCPSCELEGNALLIKDERFELKKPRLRLYYDHSNPKKMCYIGEWIKDGTLKLKKDIHPIKIGYHYWLKGQKEMHFPMN